MALINNDMGGCKGRGMTGVSLIISKIGRRTLRKRRTWSGTFVVRLCSSLRFSLQASVAVSSADLALSLIRSP
jgi:hypothetical protein